jgi:hypothetical protein
MSRNTGFVASHEPLRHLDFLTRHASRTTGAFSFLNPTRAHYTHRPPNQKSTSHQRIDSDGQEDQDVEKSSTPTKDEEYSDAYEFKWRSRDNRKGRHAIVVHASDEAHGHYITPKSTRTLHATMEGIKKMFTYFPYWDVSWLVAIIFTLGSVVWCINGFFSWLPDVDPNTEFPTEVLQGGGITAFIGATIFEIGSILLMFEAVNENRAGCFGWALEEVLEGGKKRLRPDKDSCTHHHTNKKSFVGAGNVNKSKNTTSSAGSESSADGETEKPPHSMTDGERTWQWFPSWHELSTHYLRDLGFLACLAQLFGASVFWISGFTALPGIQNVMSQGLLDGIYWTPQIIGGSGFIVSGYVSWLDSTRPES